jgi:dGTPase
MSHRFEPTLEAKLMDWADDITYSVHDLDDFYRAHRIPLHLLADRLYDQEREAFFSEVFRRHPNRGGIWADPESLKKSFNEVMIGLFPLNKLYGGTWKERASLRQFSSELIGRYMGNTTLQVKNGQCELKRDHLLLCEVAMLKELTWVYVIEAPSLVTQQFGQRSAIRGLFEIYMDASRNRSSQKLLPAYYRDALEQADENEIKRTVVDLIAGMTENQALAMYNRLTGVSVGSGLEEIVR